MEKNYYIKIPVTILNISDVYGFVNAESQNFCNIGNNCNTLQSITDPANPPFPCFLFELSETWYLYYKAQLEALNAEVFESSEAYLAKYPPKQEY
jgi:hypothetical protein